jgi:hypothetical protein
MLSAIIKMEMSESAINAPCLLTWTLGIGISFFASYIKSCSLDTLNRQQSSDIVFILFRFNYF